MQPTRKPCQLPSESTQTHPHLPPPPWFKRQLLCPAQWHLSLLGAAPPCDDPVSTQQPEIILKSESDPQSPAFMNPQWLSMTSKTLGDLTLLLLHIRPLTSCSAFSLIHGTPAKLPVLLSIRCPAFSWLRALLLLWLVWGFLSPTSPRPLHGCIFMKRNVSAPVRQKPSISSTICPLQHPILSSSYHYS